MEMVGEMEGMQGKHWFRCTRCHHTALIDVSSQESVSAVKLDASTATRYDPLQSFKVGEAIFHTEWNDVGKVISKSKMSDGSQSIMVSFEKQGTKRLIENLKPEPIEVTHV